jgi:integrase
MARVDLGYRDGRRVRKYYYGATRRQVAEQLTTALRTKQQGLPLADERQTVGQYLDRWLREVASARLRPRTLASYKQVVKAHVLPNLGRVPLARLTPQEVQGWLNDLQAGDEERERQPLSPRTCAYARAILRSALTQALRWGLVARNAAALVEPPRIKKGEIKPLTPQQARRLLKEVRGHRLAGLVTVALALGLRLGEASGLKWEDIDERRGVIHIRRALQRAEGKLVLVEPKSERSRRTIVLPAIVTKALEKHRRRQARDRAVAGDRWQNTGLVFTSTIGTALEPRNVTRDFHTLLEAAKLPRVRFHDLRHTAATLLLAQGVDPRTIMETLGHSQISLTLDTYSHVLPKLQKQAAGKMDEVLGTRGARSRQSAKGRPQATR